MSSDVIRFAPVQTGKPLDQAQEFFAKYSFLERPGSGPVTPIARRLRLAALLAEIGEVLTREVRL